MEHLLKRLESEFDEMEGWVRIIDASWYADDLCLNLSISTHEDSQPEIWKVSCAGVVEECIVSVYEETLSVSEESPLLMPYREIEVDLMFSENHCDPTCLLGILLSSCIEVFGRAEYLPRFSNQYPTVYGIVASKYGVLGRFPRPLADRVLQALKEQPIRINSLAVSVPKQWTGTEFVAYPPLKVLEVGASYVIGEHFNAERV
ncbi:hypothetical protein GCM10011297_26680 [Bacterioplanes sanyensis]|uniref:hypothetical protein n=1 Tax=Bacterioplanes sanyensis TaxID=1249553 RepID=UPI0016769B27|nr:hypothetical protein [Bacterioplanes sanyensis]GGY52435.1 hypothetical protein GCM10011297_26680 [Bacterioplanes sanyensis]